MPIQIDLGTDSQSQSAQKKEQSHGIPVGIDLGTTHSLIGTYSKESKQVELLRDSQNNALIKSVVRINLEAGKITAVGNEAYQKDTENEIKVTSIKRLMGRSFKDFESSHHQMSFPIVSDSIGAQVLVGLPTESRKFSPIEISGEILKHLKLSAQNSWGKPVGPAVITVPAYFDDAQRAATMAAGRLAGLEVLRVFNEPTAAALAYGWSHERPGKVVVFDLGGGTFDISVLRIESNIYEVLSTRGDTHLGGDDFDQAILESVLNHHPELKSLSRTALMREAERVKKELSQSESADWQLGLKKPFSISAAHAKSIWRPLLDRVFQCCSEAIKDANISVSDLDDVLLVGGSTRMPVIREEVGNFFKKAPNTSLNPDEAVALGATLQAEALAGSQAEAKLLLDVIPLSLGIETYGGAVTKLLLRNSTLPTEAREVFTNHAENQTAFDLHVLQGERELVKDCRSLARFKLKGLTPAPPGYHRIEVIFRVDANGILNVKARDLRSQKSHEIEVRPSFGISDDELFQLLESAEQNALQDMHQRQLVDIRVEAETVIRATEKTLKNVGHKLDPSDLNEVKARLIDLKNAVSGANPAAIRKCLEDLDAVGKDLAELQVNEALKMALSGKEVETFNKK